MLGLKCGGAIARPNRKSEFLCLRQNFQAHGKCGPASHSSFLHQSPESYCRNNLGLTTLSSSPRSDKLPAGALKGPPSLSAEMPIGNTSELTPVPTGKGQSGHLVTPVPGKAESSILTEKRGSLGYHLTCWSPGRSSAGTSAAGVWMWSAP